MRRDSSSRSDVASMVSVRYSHPRSGHVGGANSNAALSEETALSLPGRARAAAGPDSKSITFSEREIREAVKLLAHIISDAPELVDVIIKPVARIAREQRGDADRKYLLDLARRALFDRRHRATHFNKAMFGEPAWELLLVLYVADFVGGKQTIGNLAELVEAPTSTTVRWVGHLEREHLVVREPHPHDRRMVFVRLNKNGREALDGYFSTLAE